MGALGHWVAVTITGPGQGNRIQPTRTLPPTILLREEFRKPPSSPICDGGLGAALQESPPPPHLSSFAFFCFKVLYAPPFPLFSTRPAVPLPVLFSLVTRFYGLCDVAILVAGMAVGISRDMYLLPPLAGPLASHPLPSLLFDQKQGI